MTKKKDFGFSYTYSFADVTLLFFLQLKFRSLRVKYGKLCSLRIDEKGCWLVFWFFLLLWFSSFQGLSFVKIYSILIWIKWQGNKANSELVCYYELFLINMFEIKKKVVLT